MSGLVMQRRGDRIAAATAAGGINGIAYLEVGSPDQRTLRVYFIRPLPGQAGGVPAAPALAPGNLVIEGGVRIRNPGVVAVASAAERLTITVAEPGDFSTYRLRLLASPTSEAPPAGFDPLLAWIDFSFKAGCPNPFDCAAGTSGRADLPDDPPIDYLAKDYRGLREMMIDRLAVLSPAWRERSPADQQVMLVELLASSADQLSYFQDAVAAEAYLGTARRRASLRRHARLLDYRVHEGCNARAWVHVAPTAGGDLDGKALPAGTPLLTGAGEGEKRVDPGAVPALVFEGADVYETLHAKQLHVSHNDIGFHTWSGSVVCLHAGATTATLRAPAQPLAPGDALLLEQIRGPATGSVADADPARRWVVRLLDAVPAVDPLDGTPLLEVRWHVRDALPFDLPLVGEIADSGGIHVATLALARGNLILADYGLTSLERDALVPPVPPKDGPWRPRLKRPGIIFSEPYDHSAAQVAPASTALIQDPRHALACVRLRDGESAWSVRPDLLASDRFATEFVVEPEADGRAWLRFGDGLHGRVPAPGSAFIVTCRTGQGSAGNAGAGAIRRVATSFQGVGTVRNPLAASPGAEPESAEEIRRYAPQAFRVQRRAVTEADYAAAAQSHPEVQRARADFRWFGSWYTAVVTVDRRNGLPVGSDPRFRGELLALLDGLKTMGGDVALRDPVFVPLDILLRVCLKPDFFAEDVHRRIREVFGSGLQPDGSPGFFHPDSFTFGTPLWLSALHAAALAVDGVATVEALRFRRFGKTDAGERQAGVLRPSESQILRCDGNPSLPENGSIRFEIRGER